MDPTVEAVSPTASQSPSQITSSDSFEDVPRQSSLFLDEDHFSLHSDIDFLDDIDIRSNLSREEQLELAISRYTAQLNSLSNSNSSQLGEAELEERKRQLVKRICDIKVKLAKLREEEEYEDALKEHTDNDQNSDLSGAVLFFKRSYSLVKHVAGHKMVLSTEIYENEKRLRNLWHNQLRNYPTSPISLSPTSSPISCFSHPSPTNRLLQMFNNTSTNLSYLTGNWSGGQATNPFAQLICDQCLKRSTKSINDFLADAFKFSKKSELNVSTQSLNSQNETSRNSNPYLVCIYCFFTIHLNCLCKDIRKCPKVFFDEIDEDLIDEQYVNFYNLMKTNLSNKRMVTEPGKLKSQVSITNLSTEGHQKRMKRVILKICPEVGLSKQDFRCGECRVLLSPSSTQLRMRSPVQSAKPDLKVGTKARLCDYTGMYFCENCHIGDTAIIPARVIHNWDFRPQPVSRAALQIISYLKNTSFHFDRPVLFNLVEINPMLYGLVDELIQIKRLRSELCQIYKYISLCKQPNKPRQWIAIMCQLGSHLLNEQEIPYLSFADICDLKNLAGNLSELEGLFISHINGCQSCQGKGFFCELCPNKDDVLFPFSPNTTTCAQCYAVFHKNCYFRRNRLCPRCNRIKEKYAQRQQQMIDHPNNEPFAE